jgi:xanthine dehydrogenase accessory factor
VYEQAQKTLADGVARRLHYRQVKDSVFEIGLNCEGQIDVLLEQLTDSLLADLTARAPSVRLTGYRGVREDAGDGAADDAGDDATEVRHILVEDAPPASDTVAPEISGSPCVMDAVDAARESMQPRSVTDEAGWNYLIEPISTKPTLLIVSASSVAYPLCRLGRALGYRVVVSDPRTDYLSPERFPDADLILPVWPRELPGHIEFGLDCVVVSLNHEPRFEDDLFRVLESQPAVGYIGAIGKRQRQVERIERQTDSGYDLARLPAIHTPVGLDLGGKSPEEIALSILAEIQAVRHGRPGGELRRATDSTTGETEAVKR